LSNRLSRFAADNTHHIEELWRYYKAGVINTGFGYGLFSILVFFGLNMYAAQITSHVCGVVFNYIMFRVHVFHGAAPALRSYIGAYALSYLMGLVFLAIYHHFIPSTYVAGLCSLVTVATINYFVLKKFVFKSVKQTNEL
jgi:putative flippase GtrA